MKILITGVHGFVGSSLVEAMCNENEIYGLDIVAPKKEGVEMTYSWDDLAKGDVPEVDAIIHLAGMAEDSKDESLRDKYFAVNMGLTQKIYDYFLTSFAKKFVFFSSVKAAFEYFPSGVVTEDLKPSPVGPYGESKIAAEEYILSHTVKGKDVYILRPCMIHGPGNNGNLALLYSVVSKGIPWPLGAFEARRTFTSIDNLVFVINGLLSKNINSGIYNVGDDESLSTNELIRFICVASGKGVKILCLPKGLMISCAKLGSLIHFPFNEESLTKLTENYMVSNAKIKKALGVEKMRVTAKVGLEKTIQSFKN